ncbi:hypothetical protein [Actinomadura fibrosa]|uniref:Uncharacterized protein n=1 Tax=Actinomadura fibrosa TaxID=111802 RepID=A0ABW2XX51_9ACTN|nr:hypothetical protein [Actinomadura fibrosa]
MSLRTRLTPTHIRTYTDAWFDVARANALASGHVTEGLLLLNAQGRRKVVVNVARATFHDTRRAVKQAIDTYRAVALVHVAPYKVTWVREGVAAGLFVSGPPQEDERRIVAAEGYWPSGNLSYVRLAQVIETGGSRDVVDLTDPEVIPGGWLEELLPQR